MIYYIYDKLNNAVKIGYAKNVRHRFNAYKTHNINPLLLLHVEVGNIEKEKLLHQKYVDLKIKTEWFKCENKLLNNLLDYYGSNFTKINGSDYDNLNNSFFNKNTNAGKKEHLKKLSDNFQKNKERYSKQHKNYQNIIVEKKYEMGVSKIDEHFIKRTDAKIMVKELKEYLLTNDIKSKYGKKNIPINKLIEYFQVEMKQITWNGKRERFVVGLDYANRVTREITEA